MIFEKVANLVNSGKRVEASDKDSGGWRRRACADRVLVPLLVRHIFWQTHLIFDVVEMAPILCCSLALLWQLAAYPWIFRRYDVPFHLSVEPLDYTFGVFGNV